MKVTVNILLVLMIMTSCVQKTHKRVIVVTLEVPKVKNVQSAGLRGNGKPLSWDKDYPMQEVVKDSLYMATITTHTGYLFTEIKSTINGNFELQYQPNRRIVFDTKKDTTYVNLTFDKN